MSKAKFIFIESNISGTGRRLAKAVTEKNLEPIILSANPSQYEYAREENIKTFQVDTQSLQKMLSQCYEIAASSEIIGIMSSHDFFLESASLLAQKFRLPGPEINTIRVCRNKYEQRLKLQKGRVNIPRFHLASSIDEAVSFSNALNHYVVVKPISDSGSTGVKLCKSIDDIISHSSMLFRRRYDERGFPVLSQVLLEEVLDGPEYSVEVFGTQVIGITKKHLGNEPYFVEIGHDFPAEISSDVEMEIISITEKTLKALNWHWGPAHIELRNTKEGPKIIEVNPRLGGDYIFELIRLSCGIDLISETINAYIRVPINFEKKFNKYASIRFILPSSVGTLKEIYGKDKIINIPELHELKLYKKNGDKLTLHGDYRDRIGYFILSSDQKQSLFSLIEKNNISVTVNIQDQ